MLTCRLMTSTSMTAASALLLGAAVLLGPRVAQAAPPAPREEAPDRGKEDAYPRLLTAARDLYRLRKWAQAITVLKEAQTLRATPEVLLNLGRCHEALLQHSEALAAYRNYLMLAEGASPEKRRELKKTIEDLEKRLALPSPPITPPASPGERVQDTFSRPWVYRKRSRETPPVKPFYVRGWFWGVVGTTVAGAVIGGVLAGTRPWDRVPGGLPVDTLQR